MKIRKDLIRRNKKLWAELADFSWNVFVESCNCATENKYPPDFRSSQTQRIAELAEAIKNNHQEIIDYIIMAPFSNNNKD